MNRAALTYGLLAVIGLGLILQAFVPPVSAQEPACRYTLAATIQALTAQNVRHGLLDTNARDHFMASLESGFGIQFPAVTGILVADLPQGIFYGLEIGGCLTPPTPLLIRSVPRLSGATPAGVYA
jgi:hypothetical protein